MESVVNRPDAPVKEAESPKPRIVQYRNRRYSVRLEPVFWHALERLAEQSDMRLGRYIADASYWLYLTHLPLTIWVPGLLTGWAVSAFVKSGVTLAVTTILTVVSYHLLVRSGVIGLLLNGKRYPRALPRFDAEGNYLRPQADEVR